MRLHEGRPLRVAPAALRRLRPPQWYPSVPACKDQLPRPPDRSAPCWVRALVSVRAPNEPQHRSGRIFGVSGYCCIQRMRVRGFLSPGDRGIAG
ncbi:hypothetical protein NDU88_004070 [Pleurodeles waltl]|uniref:Uncharacterized protein n=1 Tax=Pleurodeles waltl TaxID=8319 RepID=A0AAV7M6U6_PLEWA|nr:hypothetical protein NDU88_004070 [Pleurodeles waltl]